MPAILESRNKTALAWKDQTVSYDGLLRRAWTLARDLPGGAVVFPEGTRSPDGALGPFQESYAILARELDRPVVPVAIDGAHRALPTGHRLPRLLARVSISYLDPLRPAAGETLEAFNGRVRDAIAAELARAGGRDPR